jgi:hypothetical protein
MAGALNHVAIKRHWADTVAAMQLYSTKATVTWLEDYSKGSDTTKANQLRELKVRLDVAASFVRAIDSTEVTLNRAAATIMKLDAAAAAAASSWKRRSGGKFTQDELDAEHAEFEKHRARLTKP